VRAHTRYDRLNAYLYRTSALSPTSSAISAKRAYMAMLFPSQYGSSGSVAFQRRWAVYACRWRCVVVWVWVHMYSMYNTNTKTPTHKAYDTNKHPRTLLLDGRQVDADRLLDGRDLVGRDGPGAAELDGVVGGGQDLLCMCVCVCVCVCEFVDEMGWVDLVAKHAPVTQTAEWPTDWTD
jgi:hypothetical protein